MILALATGDASVAPRRRTRPLQRPRRLRRHQRPPPRQRQRPAAIDEAALRARLRRPGGAQAGARAGRRPRQGRGQRRARPHRARRRRGLREGRRCGAAGPGEGRRRHRRPAAAGSTCCPGRRSTSRSSARSSARSCRASRRSRRANLHRNWVVIPHVTTHDEADITDLEQFRVQMNKELEKSGVKISMLPFMMKAAVATLKKFPEFNASLDGDALVLKNYWHIGFAADTPNGLMVPVIRDCRQEDGARDHQGDGRAGQAGARRQAQARPDAGRHVHDQLARRHRRHLLHADHQRARGRDHGRVQELLEAALERRQDSRAGA